MIYRIITALIIVCSFHSCSGNSQNKTKAPREKYNGIYLSNSHRRGQLFTDNDGTKYGYTYITVTFTNDTLVPFRTQLELPKEYNQYRQGYKVFLLHQIITGKIELNDDLFREEASNFLDNSLKPPVKIDKIVHPGEAFTIGIGVLYPYNIIDDDMGPSFSMFLGAGKPHFPPLPDKLIAFPDSLLNQSTTKNKIDVSIGLFFNRHKNDTINLYAVIHSGQITFSDK